MSASYWDIIAHDLTDAEKAVARRVTIAANAPSTDSAFLGAVRLIQMLKKAGVTIPADLGEDRITTLEDWNLGTSGDKAVVLGTVTRSADGRFPEGSVIHTSMLKDRPRTLKAGDVVTTQNSRYRLGRRARTVSDKHRQMARLGGFSIARVKA
jgi:hypothetical protein